MDLAACIPKDKFDTAAIGRAHAVGFPALNPILPDLLEWLQDANRPVAADASGLLAGAGPEIVPHMRTVFRSKDSIWKYGLLEILCPRLEAAVLRLLRPDIERLVGEPGENDLAEDVPDQAASILKSRKMRKV